MGALIRRLISGTGAEKKSLPYGRGSLMLTGSGFVDLVFDRSFKRAQKKTTPASCDAGVGFRYGSNPCGFGS